MLATEHIIAQQGRQRRRRDVQLAFNVRTTRNVRLLVTGRQTSSQWLHGDRRVADNNTDEDGEIAMPGRDGIGRGGVTLGIVVSGPHTDVAGCCSCNRSSATSGDDATCVCCMCVRTYRLLSVYEALFNAQSTKPRR